VRFAGRLEFLGVWEVFIVVAKNSWGERKALVDRVTSG